MILQALCDYYDRLSQTNDSEIAGKGFSSEKAHFAIVINKSGQLLQISDLRNSKGNKLIPRNVIVPQGLKKSVNIEANFLWGNTNYVLGMGDNEKLHKESKSEKDYQKKLQRVAECHKAYLVLHHNLLNRSSDEGAKATLLFLSSWKPEDADKLEYWSDMLKGNLVFQLDGEQSFIHDRPELKNIWLTHLGPQSNTKTGMCLISGAIAPIARLHPAIKGVFGAQSSGAALVSYNLDAFCSYNKSQNFNAPISDDKAVVYTKALNHLLSLNSNRIQIADTTTVFWTERDSPVEGFFGMILDPQNASAADNKDLEVFLDTIRQGKFPRDYDPNIRFYILGLSPNAARLSVRFWYISTVKDICEKIGQHFQDLAIIRSFPNDPEYPGVRRILWETTNSKSKDGPPPLLGGAVMQAILTGMPYPQELLSAVIGRIRAEQNINYLRAAIIKAVLARKQRIFKNKMEAPVALDKENKNVAYLLGRLFAVMEKAQQDAIPGANTTIKDRFYGSASSTPQIVFPQLLRLTQHHIEKAEYGRFRDKQIEEIIGEIKEFPAHLNLDQQGLFAIGYYHQRQVLFTKKNNSIEEGAQQ